MTRFVERHGKRIEVESLPPPKPLRTTRAPGFVPVPLVGAAEWAPITRTAAGFMVWLTLKYLNWKTKSRTFPLPNQLLATHGISRETKRRVLARAEAAGKIAVERRGNHAPIVTLL